MYVKPFLTLESIVKNVVPSEVCRRTKLALFLGEFHGEFRGEFCGHVVYYNHSHLLQLAQLICCGNKPHFLGHRDICETAVHLNPNPFRVLFFLVSC